jgi:hypothetical protein
MRRSEDAVTRFRALFGFFLIWVVSLLLLTTSALAAEEAEFVKVGNKIKTTGGEVSFVLSGATVECESSSGNGTVTNATQAKIEVKFGKCTSGSREAKITTCTFGLSPSDTLTMEGGCKIEVDCCLIEPSLTENKNIMEVGYVAVKEIESEPESEIFVDAKGILYKVNAACELFGIKGGKEGELHSVAAITEPEIYVVPLRKILVKEATPLATRSLTLKSTNSHVFTFGDGNTITCANVVFSNTTGEEENDRRSFNSLSWTNCTSNFFSGNPVTNVQTEAGTGCEFVLWVLDGRRATPQPGGASIEPMGCGIRATVNGCVLRFNGRQLSPGIGLTNEGTPKKINIKISKTGNGYSLHYRRISGNCGTVPAGPTWAEYKGEGELKAEITSGGAADIEVK